MKEVLLKLETPIYQNSTNFAWITTTGSVNLTIKKSEIIKSGNQRLLQKIDASLTEEEIRIFTHLILHLEPRIDGKSKIWPNKNLHRIVNSWVTSVLTNFHKDCKKCAYNSKYVRNDWFEEMLVFCGIFFILFYNEEIEVDQIDKLSYLEKKAVTNLHRIFVTKLYYHDQRLCFLFKCLLS